MPLPLLALPYVAPAMIGTGLLATAGTQYLSQPGVSQGIIDSFINNKGLLNLSNFASPSINAFRDVIDTPSGQVFAPDLGDIEEQAEYNRGLGKQTTFADDIKSEPLITPEAEKLSGLLSTPEAEQIDYSNVTEELPPSLLSDNIFTSQENKNEYPEGEGMFVIHNTGESAIQNYNKLGGIPKPSLAIAKENIDEMKFGEITLIGDPSMMNPSRDNPVYKGDAYTQRYPNVRTLYSDKDMNKIIKYFSDTFDVNDIRYDAKEIGNYKFEDGSDQHIFYSGNIYNQITEQGITNLDQTMLDMTFLKEKGLLPEVKNYNDKYEYKRALDEVFTPELNNEYKVWENNLIKNIGVEGQEKIIVGRTPMGRLKYKDHNLDNVLNAMSTKSGKEEGFGANSLGSLASTMRGKFKNIKEVKSSRDKIVNTKEFNDNKTELYDDLDKIITRLTEEHPTGKYPDIYADNFINIFSDRKYSVDSSLKQFYPNASEETNKMIKDYFKKLATTPTEYFEIKPNRAVGINEFKGAIVPNNTSNETIQILKKNGIDRIYKYNSEPDRIKKLKNFEDLYSSNIQSGLLKNLA